MMTIDEFDWSELEAKWARRSVGVQQVKARADIRGMTRPARDPAEAAFLKETGQEGPFEEVDLPGYRAWLQYRSTPPDQRTGPERNAAYFAALDRAAGLLD